MSPADEIRQAAKTLRETGAKATPAPWRMEPECVDMITSPHPTWKGQRSIVASDLEDGDGPWIALMHPGVAEPLAAWLEDVASDFVVERRTEPMTSSDEYALAIARVINGSAT